MRYWLRSPWLAEVSSVDDLKQASKSIHHGHFEAKLYDAKETHEASIPNFGRTLLPTRGGRRLLKGIAGIITRGEMGIIEIF
jgi:hypothetical protein